MTLSRIGRFSLALVVSVAVGLGMTACGGGTIGYMWVLGTTPSATAGQLTGQIAGFKIDDYTGNLTSAVRSPFASGGSNPVSIVVKPGGRFVYVVNQGVAGSGTCSSPSSDYVAGNISVFSVGGDGTLTYQTTYTSQGCTPVWASVDTTGGFLYVLDQKSPAYNPTATATNSTVDLNGDITVFSIASDTGRLSLVTNAQVKNANGTQLPYFEVGPTPIMMRVSNGCLYTLDQGDHTVFPYSVGSAGQLALTTNSTIAVSGSGSLTPKLTSISANGSFVYLTDAANNLILPYTSGGNCSLNTLTGGSVPNLGLTSNPVYTFTDSKGVYLYVLNQSGTNSNQPNSSISAFIVEPSGGKLQQVGGVSETSNPYSVGSGPVCMGEDPSGQYVYISNNADGTVTGKKINSATGQLTALSRGSTFPAVGKATCLAISGNVQ